MASLAALVALVSCEEEENLGLPTIRLGGDGTMTFETAGGDQQITLDATRDWWVECDADWLMVSPETGKASAESQTVTVTAKPNTGMDRTADVKFTIGMSFQTLTVTQTGPGGSAEDLIVYANDFDKELATQTYGTKGDKWPYLDQFDGWKNETGTGASDVEYVSGGMSARNNANSNGSYSDYDGSGNNNLLFSTNNYFAIKNIALGSARNYTVSFGTEKYAGDGDNTFVPSEFHVYVSADASKWVELAYAFPGEFKNGRWDLASSTFTLPADVNTLHMYFKSDLAGGHRIDDLKLVESAEAGTAVDFSAGKEFEVGGNTSGGGNDDVPAGTGEGTEASPYSAAKAYNVANALGADDKVEGVYVQGIIKEIKEVSTQYGNATYWITDEEGSVKFYVFRGNYLDKAKFTSEDQIKTGDKVVVYGDLMNYMGDSPQLGQGNYIVQLNETAGEGGSDDGGEAVKSDIAGVIAAADNTAVETEGLVVAKYQRGILLKDDTGYLLVYEGSSAPAEVGDKVSVSGTKTTYGGLAQIGTPTVTVVSSGNAVTHPEAKVLDGAGMDAQLTAGAVEYVEYTGTLTISGYYYNVNVAGASTAIGSLSYPDAEAYGLAALDGKEIKVTGYFVGLSGGKYVNTMITAVAATGNDSGSGDTGTEGGDTGSEDDGSGDETTPAEGNAVLTFPDGNQKAVNSYTDTWEVVAGGYTWTLTNFNNSLNNWSYVKCGRKADPSVASISVNVASKVSKVEVTVDKCLDESKVNSAKLIVAADADFANVVETVSGSAAAGTQTFAVTTPAADLYYKLEYDCSAHGSKNGIVQISKVVCVAAE